MRNSSKNQTSATAAKLMMTQSNDNIHLHGSDIKKYSDQPKVFLGSTRKTPFGQSDGNISVMDDVESMTIEEQNQQHTGLLRNTHQQKHEEKRVFAMDDDLESGRRELENV